MGYARVIWHEEWMAQHVMMRKRNTYDDKRALVHKWTRKQEQELTNTIYTAGIIHEINISNRGHYKGLRKIRFAAKAFF